MVLRAGQRGAENPQAVLNKPPSPRVKSDLGIARARLHAWQKKQAPSRRLFFTAKH